MRIIRRNASDAAVVTNGPPETKVGEKLQPRASCSENLFEDVAVPRGLALSMFAAQVGRNTLVSARGVKRPPSEVGVRHLCGMQTRPLCALLPMHGLVN